MESNDIDVVIFGVTDLVELEADLVRLKNRGNYYYLDCPN
jgi:hypothetical protein